MKTLEVAVVGSGPAGLYTAEALIKQAAALPQPVTLRVEVLDRLPTPYGLVRYGVAPDHKSIKSIAEYLRKVLEHPDVAFIGGVHLGDDELYAAIPNWLVSPQGSGQTGKIMTEPTK